MLLSRSAILCIAVLSACVQDEEVKPPSKTGTYTGTVSVMGYLSAGLLYLGKAEVNVAQDGPYVIAVASVEFGGVRLVAGVFEGTIDAIGRFYSHKDLVDLGNYRSDKCGQMSQAESYLNFPPDEVEVEFSWITEACKTIEVTGTLTR